MSDGLVTRIGKWIDSKFEDKATLAQLNDLQDRLEGLRRAHSGLEISDLKTRIEKVELYCGMTRKVDPTKPSVVKSAFSM